ncbi:hypothetical protein V8E55_006632 [Tylopilus felleus]
MLSRISQSSDQNIRALQCQYVNPGETRKTIQRAVQDAIRESPQVLINTISGKLCDKSQQAVLFESLPVFNELISSMTQQIDHNRIEQDVSDYYRYAMFSHRWEGNEPLFEDVIRTAVQSLGKSHTHHKLKMFCKIVHDASLQWAWSDTCCINKADSAVQQEALVAMFKWYQGSTLTVIFLCDVPSQSRRGALIESIWNTRAWTFQEYHASKVVRFYTKDWTLYLNLDVPNHKESPAIISEMQAVTGVSARVLMALRPGLNDIREKLYLASTRHATRVEDAAYSLLGIFSMTLTASYGEGDRSLGRLLAHLLPSSGDTGILAWSGKSGTFNSCLPANITVFNQRSPPHLPLAITSAEMEKTTARLRASSLDPSLVMNLYNRLHALPVPSFVARRLRLPCLTFNIQPESVTRNASEFVLRTVTDALGIVDITTKEDVSRLDSLILVHPWIDYLLDKRPIEDESSISKAPLRGRSNNTLLPPATEKATPPSPVRPVVRAFTYPPPATSLQTHALELVARLRQPFGALLFTPIRRNTHEYRRVAADSLIIVQIQENIPLNFLMENTRTLDVL